MCRYGIHGVLPCSVVLAVVENADQFAPLSFMPKPPSARPIWSVHQSILFDVGPSAKSTHRGVCE